MSAGNDKTPLDIDFPMLYQMMRDLRQEVLDAIRDLSGRVAVAQKDVIAMTGTMESIVKNDADSRVSRLQQEIADVEREKKVLEARQLVVDEKIAEKKTAAVGALDTTGRMKAAAQLTYEEREQLEKDARAATWDRRKEAIVTAVLVSTSVGFVGAVIGAIWWFVIFYMSNR